ncbi:hypothetical protein C8R44DRAFT_978615, partial [Mycena epipterygia]
MAAMASPRRTHRKRVSLRLSADSTFSGNTLPEYAGWRDVLPPPEYDSEAADADEDTDNDDDPLPYIPPTPVSPRRRTQHRRRQSSPLPQDVFLDSLLERSVHALELSNALLQSSMSTPSSSVFREPSPTAPVPMPPPRESWADNLAAISRDVDDLLVSSSLPSTVSTSPHRRPRRRPSLDPISSSYSHSHSHSSAGLHMAPQPRARLVSPAPRALTQFVGSGAADDTTIALPSTLGLRAAASDWRGVPSGPALSARAPEPSTPAYTMLSSFVHVPPPVRRASSRSSSRGRSSPAQAHTPRRALTPPVERPESAQSTPSSSHRARSSSPLPLPFTSHSKSQAGNLSRSPNAGSGTLMRSSNASSSTLMRSPNASSSTLMRSPNASSSTLTRSPPAKSPNGSTSTFTTAHPNASTLTISHTLPSPTHSPQASSDDGDGDGCRAKEARSALRTILEKAPVVPPPTRPSRKFQPTSPPPAAHAAPSTATASVSRLFTRGGRHSVSAHAEGQVQGIMKGGTRTPTTPVTPGFGSGLPGASGAGVSGSGAGLPSAGGFFASGSGIGGSGIGWGGIGSGSGNGSKANGSGASTPRSAKRISFAQLPESYAASSPAHTSFRTKSKARSSSRSKSKSASRKGKGKGKGREGEEEGEEGIG